MTARNNETLVRNLFNAFINRKFDEIEKNVTDRVEWHDMATGEVHRGPKGVRQFLEGWVSAFTDLKPDMQKARIIATDRDVVTEFIARGTHTGPLRTPDGEVPATNREIEIPFCELATIENGKVVAVRTYFDRATLMTQLGVSELAGASR